MGQVGIEQIVQVWLKYETIFYLYDIKQLVSNNIILLVHIMHITFWTVHNGTVCKRTD